MKAPGVVQLQGRRMVQVEGETCLALESIEHVPSPPQDHCTTDPHYEKRSYRNYIQHPGWDSHPSQDNHLAITPKPFITIFKNNLQWFYNIFLNGCQ